MRLTRTIVTFLLLTLFLGTGTLFAQVKAEARLDTTSILIGDQVRLLFTVTAPARAQVLWPVLPDTLYNGIQVIQRGPVDTVLSADKAQKTLSQKLVLTSFDSGFYTISAIPFYYRVPPDTTTLVAETDMFYLKVSGVSVDTTKSIKPIKGIMRVPFTFRDLLPYLLGALILGIVALFVAYYLRKRKRKEPVFSLIPKVELKPHEIALAEFERLREKKLWQGGRMKEYYTELTDILRRYLEARFGIQALESTTDEILESLRDGGHAGAPQLAVLSPVLTTADLVKFAKALPVGPENEANLESSVRFVQETIPAATTT